MDAVILRTTYLERAVIGVTDAVWGLCDGMNDRGLAVSLTFGGRASMGEGFGAPIVIRYLLETCDTVEEARAVLARLPSAHTHNLTLADASGGVLTAYLNPDRPPSFRRLPIAVNHQWAVESWDPVLAESTLQREWWLLRLLDDPDVDHERFLGRLPRAAALQPGPRRGSGAPCTRPPTIRPRATSRTCGRRSGWPCGSTRSSRASTRSCSRPRRRRSEGRPRFARSGQSRRRCSSRRSHPVLLEAWSAFTAASSRASATTGSSLTFAASSIASAVSTVAACAASAPTISVLASSFCMGPSSIVTGAGPASGRTAAGAAQMMRCAATYVHVRV